MKEPDKIRKNVSRAYSQALSRGSCCGESAIPHGAAAKLAGYARNEISRLPADAVVNSFGCGNPLAFGGVRAGEVVLDLGSGAGIDLLIAAERVGPGGRVIGVDMTDEMIARARENIASSGHLNIEVRKGLIEDLPVAPASVDWVISNCVINLSPEKHRVFAEIARVLKPGGRMLVSDIVVHDLPAWVRESPAFHSACVAGAVSEEEYVAGLRRAGLAEVSVLQRLVYEESQIKALIESEFPEGGSSCSCGCGPGMGQVLSAAAGELAGKISSATFSARKPGAQEDVCHRRSQDRSALAGGEK